MKITVKSLLLLGIVPVVVPVIVEAEPGEASFALNGLPDVHVRETRVRCRAAIQQLGVDLTAWKITVTVDIPLGASGTIDMAVAVGVLFAIGKRTTDLEDTAFIGELSLTAAVRPVRGVAPYVAFANASGIGRLVLPLANRTEAAHASHHAKARTQLVFIDSLAEPFESNQWEAVDLTPRGLSSSASDLSDVRGLDDARRALEVAAVGGYSILFIASPGTGATMLSRRLCGILPTMTVEEQVEATAIHSTTGLLRAEQGWVSERPFRAPHHTCSASGLLGGGNPGRPGELSLATHGVLLLDELLEFRRDVIERVSDALKAGESRIATGVTSTSHVTRHVFPTRPTLVATVGPCPCGYHGAIATKACVCSPERIAAHVARLRSSKLWEHFDLHVRLTTAPTAYPTEDSNPIERGETSAMVRARVVAAKARHTPALGNDLGERNVLRKLALDDARERPMKEVDRIFLIARTIARMDGSDVVKPEHVVEARGLRVIVKGEVVA